MNVLFQNQRSRLVIILVFSLAACSPKSQNQTLPTSSANTAGSQIQNLAGQTSPSSKLPTDKPGVGNDYLVGKINIERTTVSQLSGEGHPQVIAFVLSICLRDAVSEKPLLNKKFRIEESKQKELVTDSDTGCLHWDQEISFDYLATENYFRQGLTVQSGEPFYTNRAKVLKLFIDPWQYKDSTLAIIDERFQTPPKILDASQDPNQALRVSWGSFTFIGREFEIDKFLNLATTRTYRFNIKPVVPRLSLQGWQEDDLGNGRYKMRVLLETSNESDALVINDQIIDVESHGGEISIELPFRFDDLRFVNNRLFVTLLLKATSGGGKIKSVPLISAVDLVNGGGFHFDPRERALPKISPHKAREKLISVASENLLFAHAKAEAFTDAEIAAVSLNTADASPLFDLKNESEFGKLCGLYFAGGWFGSVDACKARPKDYLAVSLTEHVQSIHAVHLKKVDTANMTMSATVSQSDADSVTDAKGINSAVDARVDVGFHVPLLDKLGINTGFSVGYGSSVFWSTTYAKARTLSNTRTTDLSRVLVVDEVRFDIEGKTKKCLWVAPKNPDKAVRKSTLALCQKQGTPRQFSEVYYFLYRPILASALQDVLGGVNNRPFMTLIRGQKRYENFLRLAQDANVTLILSKPVGDAQEVYNQALMRMDGFFPGLLGPENQK